MKSEFDIAKENEKLKDIIWWKNFCMGGRDYANKKEYEDNGI